MKYAEGSPIRSEFFKFTVSTGRWSQMAVEGARPLARAFADTVLRTTEAGPQAIGAGWYLHGGVGAGGNTYLNDLWFLSHAGAWTEHPRSISAPASVMGALWYFRGYLFLWQGYDLEGGFSPKLDAHLGMWTCAEQQDGSVTQWEQLKPVSSHRNWRIWRRGR